MSEKERSGRGEHLLAGLRSLRERVQSASSSEAPPIQEEPELLPAPPERRSGALDVPEDSVLRVLWDRWSGGEPFPELTLAEAPQGRSVLLSQEELEAEAALLLPLLEGRAALLLRTLEKEDAPPVDTQCVVHVARNRMMAWLFALPPFGGEELSAARAAKALSEARVSGGVDQAAIDTLLQPPRYFRLCPVAWGTPPQEGRDGEIVDRYPREGSRHMAEDERGNIDFRAQSYVQNIAKGDVICDILPPQPGADGVDVTGRPVRAKPVTPAKAPKGSNTDLTPDGTALVASMDGHLAFAGAAFQVKPWLEVPGDVDYSVGNLDFRGDLHIRGSVKENFTVRATGTITIDGTVEGATIEADGDIVIMGGVSGNHKALLRSKKSVRARFLENCVVYSGDCTYAECILSSQVYSDNRISVLSGRGTVIGGCLTAACRVEAAVVGSKAGRKTEIILGAFPYVQMEYKDNHHELSAIRRELSELRQRLNYLEAHQDSPGNAKELAGDRLRSSVLALKESRLVKRQEEIEDKRPDLGQCRFECRTVYPVTDLWIGTAFRRIDTVWQGCKAVYGAEEAEVKFV